VVFNDGALIQRLDLAPITDRPIELARHLRQHVPTGKKPKKKDEEKLLGDIARFMGGLVLNHGKAVGGWSFRSQFSKRFVGQPVGYKHYIKIRDALVAADLLEVDYGGNRPAPFANFGGPAFISHRAARLRPKASLLEIAQAYGIGPGTVYVHYTDEKRGKVTASSPEKVVVLRSSSLRHRTQKFKGHDIPLPTTPKLNGMADRLKALNEFLLGFEMTGPAFHGYYRLFGDGDMNLTKGGRLYDRGGYQAVAKDERLMMTIGGSHVVELDINASHLTIYAALKGCPLPGDQDPYVIEGLDRQYVKSWVAATLGHVRFHERWPQASLNQLAGAGLTVGGEFTVRGVGKKVLEVHPFLRDRPETPISWGDLQFIESEAIMGTMLHLKDAFGIPALSVHDSIIVREQDEETATAILMDHYKVEVGVYPRLKVNYRGRPARTVTPQDRPSFGPMAMALPVCSRLLPEQLPQDASQVAQDDSGIEGRPSRTLRA
jgi:hypothetical protein